jgi:hypothetical protein
MALALAMALAFTGRFFAMGSDERGHHRIRRLHPGGGAAPIPLLDAVVLAGIQRRLHRTAHGVGTAAIGLSERLQALTCAEPLHHLGFLAVAEPGGWHGAVILTALHSRRLNAKPVI